jgi:radical SAM superfamily enzyme YgiQ (UPF0313 family)
VGELGRDGAIVLVSCYELGHPPHGLALTAGFLERAEFAPRLYDLARAPLDVAAISEARFIGISVPMHTALRLGAALAARLRAAAPGAHICFFGHYAPLNEAYLRASGADSVLGGEHEEQLLALVAALDGGEAAPASTGVPLARLRYPVPSRRRLPGLEGYARLETGHATRLAGYTETSRGCKHMCRHCPIPAVYGGRFVAIPREVVLADVEQQVAAGARHITFGDPDFFNGPRHGLAIARAMAERWPEVSFDATIKVSHLVRHERETRELATLGCAFVVTAVESLDDDVLARLAKGHTRADVDRAFAVCADAGLALRPTFVPFTPWTSFDSLVELVEVLAARGLAHAVDPIQLTIRLLVPAGSLLLSGPDAAWFGELDPAQLGHRWAHPDPRLDALQRELAAQCERAVRDREPPAQTFAALRELIWLAAGRSAPPPPDAGAPTPRLSEPWFC